jgi:alkaline phosphatase
LSNRLQTEAAVVQTRPNGLDVSVANPARDRDEKIAGFLVSGTIENGETWCIATDRCRGDTASDPQTSAGHTASDVPLSATGPGARQFTGVYENTDVFIKVLRAMSGADR